MIGVQLSDDKCSNAIAVDEYVAYIEPNPDSWRGGFVWSVCLGDAALESSRERLMSAT